MKPSNNLIANIDLQILGLLDRRCQSVASEVRTDWSAHLDSIEHVLANNSAHPLSEETRRSILRQVASACFNVNRPLSAAFLGPVDSYSHLAVLKYFGESIDAIPVATIASVFDAVERGQCDRGIVPIENSTDGRIVDTLGRLINDQVYLVGEVLVPIHHYLLSSVDRDQIQEVHSKPQAISQCRNWLANHLPHAKLVESASTADAAKLASTTLGIAAIASEQAGRRFGLQVIAPEIEDNRRNVTRFVVLGRDNPPPTANDKTTLLFQVAHQPGALADVMMVFKEAELNLTWIESFPLPGKPNEYFFLVEFPGHQYDPAIKPTLQRLSSHTRSLQVLGSYAAAKA